MHVKLRVLNIGITVWLPSQLAGRWCSVYIRCYMWGTIFHYASTLLQASLLHLHKTHSNPGHISFKSHYQYTCWFTTRVPHTPWSPTKEWYVYVVSDIRYQGYSGGIIHEKPPTCPDHFIQPNPITRPRPHLLYIKSPIYEDRRTFIYIDGLGFVSCFWHIMNFSYAILFSYCDYLSR